VSATPPHNSRPTRDNPIRHFAIAFAIAIVLYVVAFGWIQHRRTRKGPWQITFTNNAGTPAIVINQPWLQLTNVTLLFPGQQLPTPTNQLPFSFRDPRQTPFDAGFARCIFEDLTFLPGTVTLKAYNHEIELLPRVLIIDRHETPWKSGESIVPQSKQNTTN
jgi:hypothetical protein